MQCIHGTPDTLTMAVRALGLVLLFSFVVALSGLPTLTPLDSIANKHEEHALSIELQPPPLDEKEHHTSIYLINLYAVKNDSGNTAEDIFENEVIETVPDILEPFATVLLVVDDDDYEDEEIEKHSINGIDEIANELEDKGMQVDRINLKNNAKLVRVKLHKVDAQKMVDAAAQPGEARKDRKKRTICLKCGGGGGGGRGHGGGRRGGYYPPSGGGGCNTCGGGGGGSYSQASASASSSSWGGK